MRPLPVQTLSNLLWAAVEELMEPMKWSDSAVISENIHVFAASEGLARGVSATHRVYRLDA